MTGGTVTLVNPFRSQAAVWAKLNSFYDPKEAVAMEAGKRLANGPMLAADLLVVCKWKSVRRIGELNKAFMGDWNFRLKEALELIKQQMPFEALALLRGLPGVDYPMASAILCAVTGGNFPIIDERALRALGHPNPKGARYSKNYVRDYIDFCRKEAAALKVSVRDLDRALWLYDSDRGNYERTYVARTAVLDGADKQSGQPHLDRSPSGPDAYVTLVTNEAYLPGARALVNSLRRTGTPADIVILHTPAVGPETLAPLGARLACADLLPTSDAFNEAHSRRAVHDRAPFTKGEKPAFHTPLDNFVKLRLWQLPYARTVFLDADTIVLQNIDRLFAYPEFSAAPNVYESLADFRRLNSGVFAARPDPDTFAEMLARLDAPGAVWRRTDQTFLEAFFPNWHGLPVYDNLLQYVWLNLPELWDWRLANVIHYQYEKPWDPANPKAQRLEPLIALWQAFHDDAPLPDLPDPCASS